MSVHFSIDSIAIRDVRLFGWGWVLNTGCEAASCELEVPLADGRRWKFAGVFQGRREDVAAAFPGVPHAAGAGFGLRGMAPAPLIAGTAVFRVRFDDGTTREWSLPGFPSRFQAGGARSGLRRFMALLRSQGVRVASARVIQALRQVALAWWRAVDAAVQRWRVPLRAPVVVFDHAMGGGANRARERLVQGHLSAGRTVAVITPVLAELGYRLHVRGPRGQWVLDGGDLEPLLAMLERARPAAIEVNDLVTFADVGRVQRWCLAHKSRGTALAFHLHDFHAACPAFTLVDLHDRFCAIPGYEVCATCLPANPTHTLGFHQHVALPDWRARWAEFLTQVDRIVAFSQDSIGWLQRAFPGLPLDHVVLQPPWPEVAPLRPVRPSPHRRPLVVAAVGHLSVPKGAEMLRTLATLAHERGLPLRFVVVGTTDRPCAQIPVTGPFRRDELSAILERLGVGACLLPSICPETYSFVTDELMQTGLPVAVFDVGAPPERVRAYPSGLVLPLAPDAALQAMMCAWIADAAAVEKQA